MGNPVAELFGRWMVLQQMGKQLAWTFDKEAVFAVTVRVRVLASPDPDTITSADLGTVECGPCQSTRTSA